MSPELVETPSVDTADRRHQRSPLITLEHSKMMKKSLIAVAAMAVAGIVSAQSSITLFGVVDAAVSYYDAKTTLANGASVKQSQ